MFCRVLADIIVLLHLAFIIFVILGGFFVLRRTSYAWLHLPAVLWAILISFFNWLCPITPLENWLREKGGGIGYQSGFIEHYILPVLYPTGLTRELQITMGCLVLGINLGIYGRIVYRALKSRAQEN